MLCLSRFLTLLLSLIQLTVLAFVVAADTRHCSMETLRNSSGLITLSRNRSCSVKIWQIQVGKRIKLSIEHFETQAGNEILQVRSRQHEILMTFTGIEAHGKEILLSGFNNLLYFSNVTESNASFVMNYSVYIPKRPPCPSKTLIGNNGTIILKSFKSYQNCSWIIAADSVVKLNFMNYLTLPEGEALTIKSLKTEFSQSFSRFLIKGIPHFWHGPLHVTFTSKQMPYTGGKGFVIQYSAITSGVNYLCQNQILNESISLISFVTKRHNASCSWSLNTSKIVTIKFLRYYVKPVNLRSIFIMSDNDLNNTASLSKEIWPGSTFKVRGPAHVKFYTHTGSEEAWFIAKLIYHPSATSSCDVFHTSSGRIEFEQNVLLDKEMCWFIQTESKLRLKFLKFESQSHRTALIIKPGTSLITLSDDKFMTVSGSLIPPSVILLQGPVVLRFASSESIIPSNFVLQFNRYVGNEYFHSNEMKEIINGGFGYRTSNLKLFNPNYGNNWHNSWVILAKSNEIVKVQFFSFDTQPNRDFVKIYLGNNSDSDLIFSHSGTLLPFTAVSAAGSVTLEFTSDSRSVRSGFSFEYSVFAYNVQEISRVGNESNYLLHHLQISSIQCHTTSSKYSNQSMPTKVQSLHRFEVEIPEETCEAVTCFLKSRTVVNEVELKIRSPRDNPVAVSFNYSLSPASSADGDGSDVLLIATATSFGECSHVRHHCIFNRTDVSVLQELKPQKMHTYHHKNGLIDIRTTYSIPLELSAFSTKIGQPISFTICELASGDKAKFNIPTTFYEYINRSTIVNKSKNYIHLAAAAAAGFCTAVALAAAAALIDRWRRRGHRSVTQLDDSVSEVNLIFSRIMDDNSEETQLQK